MTTDSAHDDTDQDERDGPPVQLVTISQATEILALSRSTMYQPMWNNELAPTRIGRCVRVTVRQLEAFVADRRTGVG